MRNVAIVVEGQTEDAFVRTVLGPYLGDDVNLQPIITHTKRAATGAFKGGGSWKGYRNLLEKLVRQPQWDMVTTLIDYYAYPRDAPGTELIDPSPARRAEMIESAMKASIRGDWEPFVMLHEFETLVIAAGASLPETANPAGVAGKFERMIREAGGAELVNDDPATAPSKRVKYVFGTYSRAVDGVDIIRQVGLDAVLRECTRFSGWVDSLRGD